MTEPMELEELQDEPRVFDGALHPFLKLNEDVQLYILAFCDAYELWSFGWTNHSIRERIHGATFLLQELLMRKWPMWDRQAMQLTKEQQQQQQQQLQSRNAGRFQSYPFCLRLLPKTFPTRLDERLFVPGFCRPPMLRRSRHTHCTPRFRLLEEGESIDNNNNTVVVIPGDPNNRLSGLNRCVRSDFAFPRPNRSPISAIHERLRPFCIPHLRAVNDNDRFDLSPRLVVYYEVTIHNDSQDQPPSSPLGDCVAVGISTIEFTSYMFQRMPGWDRRSYGYHGDDGCVFHARRRLPRVFPLFSKGDTVGCGIDYTNNGVFFTLNGDFLDYAWTNQSILYEELWYPTVGIDTGTPVSINFGHTRPFMFNLSSMLSHHPNHARVVEEGGLLRRAPPPPDDDDDAAARAPDEDEILALANLVPRATPTPADIARIRAERRHYIRSAVARRRGNPPPPT